MIINYYTISLKLDMMLIEHWKKHITSEFHFRQNIPSRIICQFSKMGKFKKGNNYGFKPKYVPHNKGKLHEKKRKLTCTIHESWQGNPTTGDASTLSVRGAGNDAQAWVPPTASAKTPEKGRKPWDFKSGWILRVTITILLTFLNYETKPLWVENIFSNSQNRPTYGQIGWNKGYP